MRADKSDNCLDGGPVALPQDWIAVVNIPQTEAELRDFRTRMNLGHPFGHQGWLKDATVTRP
jgi:hypothetical protein